MEAEYSLTSVNDLEHLTTALREAEIDWKRTATLLTTKLYDRASELHIDLDDLYQTEYELTMKIEALKAQGRRRQTATLEEGAESAVNSSPLEVAAMAAKLSKKVDLLKEEVRKVKEAAATLEDLDWQPDEAPLAVMLLFS